jgi:hypothetical protein
MQDSTPRQSTESLLQDSKATPDPAEDDTPRAGPPKSAPPEDGTSNRAFEALAAAGSALSSAFGPAVGMPRDEWEASDNSTDPSTRDATPVVERPGGLSPVAEVLSVASSAPPSPPSKDGPYQPKAPQQGYFPSPLRTSKPSESPPAPSRPPMLPALSTDTSPLDTESDRLRKEIVLSLTPKPAQDSSPPRRESEAGLFQQAIRATKTTDSLTREQSTSQNTSVSGEAAQDKRDPNPGENVHGSYAPSPLEEESRASPTEALTTISSRAPQIPKKFSLEMSAESVPRASEPSEPLAVTGSRSGPGQATEMAEPSQAVDRLPGPASVTYPSPSGPSDENHSDKTQNRPTVIPVSDPEHFEQEPLRPPPVAKYVDDTLRDTDPDPMQRPPSSDQSPPDVVASNSTAQMESKDGVQYGNQRLLHSVTASDTSFRSMLALKTPQDRIRAYDSARQRVATQESGLADWLQSTGHQHPEHQSLLDRNGLPLSQQTRPVQHHHTASGSRSKFGRLGGSLGGVGGGSGGGQQSHADSGEASKPAFGSPSSGKMTSQQVQEEGKKLLQSAGKFGGKAGGAAKGLFAKGKIRFRPSGGSDKVDA